MAGIISEALSWMPHTHIASIKLQKVRCYRSCFGGTGKIVYECDWKLKYENFCVIPIMLCILFDRREQQLESFDLTEFQRIQLTIKYLPKLE